eukprot:TRINITY_DN5897_c0_g1_i1.p1 TRINITY_DN5897_c0_g1~~TRINITY_DN5897_c0_g1_i1.p1  ORF type:complete len:334 (+),score=47.66 TRINITY_DN5897_c0_g1_i1:57-1004(+)
MSTETALTISVAIQNRCKATLPMIRKAVGCSEGSVYTADLAVLKTEKDLKGYLEAGGSNVMVVNEISEEETQRLDEEVVLLRATVERMREEKMALFEQIKGQTREMAIQKYRIAELEKERKATKDIITCSVGSLSACPPDAPLPVSLHFDKKFCGSSVELSADGLRVKATHSYNKIALCEPAFDSKQDTYAEFVLKTNISKFTTIGVILESGLSRLNLNTDSLGEHPYSFAWGGHQYWTAAFITDGSSKGPKGGEWVKGSRIGVFVSSNAVSFYLDGSLKHQHVFTNLEGTFRFGVGFGGPKSGDGEYGTIDIVV